METRLNGTSGVLPFRLEHRTMGPRLPSRPACVHEAAEPSRPRAPGITNMTPEPDPFEKSTSLLCQDVRSMRCSCVFMGQSFLSLSLLVRYARTRFGFSFDISNLTWHFGDGFWGGNKGWKLSFSGAQTLVYTGRHRLIPLSHESGSYLVCPEILGYPGEPSMRLVSTPMRLDSAFRSSRSGEHQDDGSFRRLVIITHYGQDAQYGRGGGAQATVFLLPRGLLGCGYSIGIFSLGCDLDVNRTRHEYEALQVKKETRSRTEGNNERLIVHVR
jgi:hypothetical protein